MENEKFKVLKNELNQRIMEGIVNGYQSKIRENKYMRYLLGKVLGSCSAYPSDYMLPQSLLGEIEIFLDDSKLKASEE